MEKIFTKDDINSYLHEDYNIDKVNFNISKTNNLSDRTFKGLEKRGIIDSNNREEYTILYDSDGDRIAKSVFAIVKNICYISWIYIVEELRGLGYGSKLLSQTLNEIKKYKINRIYVIPKSTEAKELFKKYNFNRMENSNYMTKSI